jgi:tRNA modification GTPase
VKADTIYALSSGSPPAAIAVIRISGPTADAALLALARRLPPPRQASLVSLRESGNLLDRALALRFPGPASATGEDLVELHLHGGRAVVAAVAEALGRIDGLRAAEPGEFTRRAFEHGRIDFAEAEGLADLLQAETQPQREAALALASGMFSRRIEGWQESLLALSAELEAILDFSDEGEVGEAMPPAWQMRVAALREEITTTLAGPSIEKLREGIRVVIAGPPNAGKSSLLNAIIGRDAAITSSLPGTTRDIVEAPAAIGGTAFLLVDTAGLRDSDDEIERIGIARARSNLDAADIILWLGPREDAPSGEHVLLVNSKADLRPPLGAEYDGMPVSAKTGTGIEGLLNALMHHAKKTWPGPDAMAINLRHRHALSGAARALDEAAECSDTLICAELLREARNWLHQITGKLGVEDMLDSLFGRFCIGK